MTVKPRPEGYHAVTPYLLVDDCAKLIDFLQRTFDATVTESVSGEDGAINHAEVRIDDSVVMMGRAPAERPRSHAMLYVYVDDVDATYRRALDAGAESVREPTTEFYGDRSGGVADPFGNQWWMATHVEDVPPDELQRRAAERGNS